MQSCRNQVRSNTRHGAQPLQFANPLHKDCSILLELLFGRLPGCGSTLGYNKELPQVCNSP